ncbi:DUF3800 domain-containing protein [Thiohalophilus sp.]|uniref:DUF3800 domain-containing protein n=1 Tax=Thiohalophilus sp. TaxID=3028392 RepID=UPI002ACD8F7C|nr:DUF3800 domain-containing protein [Thiohalophilus sp.]MDZ7804150.1 DUF3800 domain-containing protein [Thiohalophilus sp.]
MKVLFLDESGDHNLAIIDPQYPLFVLGGVIVDQDYAAGVMTDRLNAFKQKHFGTTEIILHTADITRNKCGFERMKEKQFRENFYRDLNDLMRSLDYTVVACVIRKDDHISRYGVAALDPYLMSLDILVERFCMEVGNREDGGVIVAERRDPTLDRELDLAWLNLKIQGTHYMQAREIEHRITGLNLRPKTANLAGLQLADLIVTPIGRYILGKTIKEDYRIIESKFRRGRTGDHEGYGLVVLPK